jgi:hypothetical protein
MQRKRFINILKLRSELSEKLLHPSTSYQIKPSEYNGQRIQEFYTGRFIMFSVITNIYNKKTKGPSLMELFTATGKLKKFFFDN